MNRCITLPGFLLLALFMLALNAHAQSSDRDLLVGSWRHQQMVQVADGKIVRTVESNGDATLEYRVDGRWSLTSPTNSNSGTYRWIDENSLESIIVKSDLANQVGWHSVKKVQVNSQFLQMTTTYDENDMRAFPVRVDGTRPKEMIVTSTFERVTGR